VGWSVRVAVRVGVAVNGTVRVGVEVKVGVRVPVRVEVGVYVEVLVGVAEATGVAVVNNRAVRFQSNGSAITTYTAMKNRQQQISRIAVPPRIIAVLRPREGGDGGVNCVANYFTWITNAIRKIPSFISEYPITTYGIGFNTLVL
jgi:hypothetical protein